MKTDSRHVAHSLAAAAATLLLAVSCASNPPVESPPGWKLVWNDEFDGSKLDLTKWSYQTGTGAEYGLDGWGNAEKEYYTEQNVTVKGGTLRIVAQAEPTEGKPYASGRIRTMGSDGKALFATRFGRVEARMKLPAGDGIWPAFWMLPAVDTYGAWAASGEIDIMESRGRLPNRVYGTLHYGQTWPGNKYTGDRYSFPEGTDSRDFHRYALEWEPGEIRWYVDDDLFYKTSSWWGQGTGEPDPWAYPAPFDVPFYVLLNLAVGGNFDDGREPSPAELPAVMEVDWVRVFEKEGGYDMNVKKPVPPRDEAAFEAFETFAGGNYIADPDMLEADGEAMSSNRMDMNARSWYFLALSEFGGRAVSSLKDGVREAVPKAPGSEVHSIQLIQHLPIAKGYDYVIEFDASADAERTIAVKLGGDGDNGWAVYSSLYAPRLGPETARFRYRFTMENATDRTARLEFNLGKSDIPVRISNVSVTVTGL